MKEAQFEATMVKQATPAVSLSSSGSCEHHCSKISAVLGFVLIVPLFLFSMEWLPSDIGHVHCQRSGFLCEDHNIPSNHMNLNIREKTIAKENTMMMKTAESPQSKHSSTASPKQEQQQRRQRPLFVLHIGPAKTGSSTLQERFLAMSPFLNRDGYTYQGPYAFHAWPALNLGLKQECQNQVALTKQQLGTKNASTAVSASAALDVPCWKQFISWLEYFYESGMNVVLVDEDLSFQQVTNLKANTPFDIDLFLSALKDWDILLTATYRRFWDWLVSSKSELDRMHSWPNPHKKCPLSFDEWLKPMLTAQGRAGTENGWHFQYLDSAMARLTTLQRSSSVSPIQIVDMAGSKDIEVAFLCDVLPNATSACTEISRVEPLYSNPSPPVNYDVLACSAAQEHGLVQVTTQAQRAALTTAMEKFHQTVLQKRPLPERCVSNATLHLLWTESQRLERELVPSIFASRDLSEEQSLFWQAASKGKFCTIDTRAFLQDAEWKQFFLNFDKRSL